MTYKHGLAVACAGSILGLVLAAPIAATRPLPAPMIDRVEVPSADRLDTGASCIYTWNGDLYEWTRADLGITLRQACPDRKTARARWELSQHGPQVVPE